MRNSSRSGFTIIELLVVVAIIGTIGAIVLVSLSESREHSRNTARISQIKEYQKAFDLYYSDKGHYPKFGNNETATICLGDYDDNRCWANGTGFFERAAVNAEIAPLYMGRIPDGETKMFGQGGGTEYEGMIYIHQDFGKAYSIRYFMEGNDKSCILDGTVASNVGDDTLCILSVGS